MSVLLWVKLRLLDLWTLQKWDSESEIPEIDGKAFKREI